MSVVIYLFLLFLSVIGLCEVVHYLSLLLFYKRSLKNKHLICLLKDDLCDLELQFIIEQYSWLGNKYADKIFAVNFLDTDSELYGRCQEIAAKNNIQIVEPREIENILLTEF